MQDNKLFEKFSLKDKILMGAGFYGVMIIAIYAIYLQSLTWALIYIGVVIFGIVVLFGYCLCSHCPYPHHHSDCLFPPFGQLFHKIYGFKAQPLTIIDKIGVWVIMVGITIIMPQYWLFKDYTLLAIFWIVCIPTFAGFLLYTCRRCRFYACPLNSAERD